MDRPMMDRRLMLLSRSRREQEGDSDSDNGLDDIDRDIERDEHLSRAFTQQASVRDYHRGAGSGLVGSDPRGRQLAAQREFAAEYDEQEDDEDDEEYTVEVWDALDTLEQLKPIVASGPRWKLEEFLRATDILQEMQDFFSRNDCAAGVRDAEKLMSAAMDHLLEEFRDAVGRISKPLSACMLREVAMSSQAGRLVEQQQQQQHPPALVPRIPTSSSVSSSRSRTTPTPTAASSPDSSGSNSPTNSAAAAGRPVSAATHLALQDWLSAGAVPFLHRMAVKLVNGGEAHRCTDQYVKVRSDAVQRSVCELDIRRVLKSALEEMTWHELEALMKAWVHDMRVMVLVLLGGEAMLCDEIFDSLEPDRELCYFALIQSSGMSVNLESLISNGRMVAAGRNTPERLFALLDMFTTVRELKPHIEGVLSVPGFQSVLREMERLPKDLASAVMDTIAEFKRVLEEPPTQQAPAHEKKKGMLKPFLSRNSSSSSGSEMQPEEVEVATAATHPLTSYVVNYMNNLLDKQSKRHYPVTLEYLLLEYGRTAAAATPDASAVPAVTRSGPQYNRTPFSGPAGAAAGADRRLGSGGSSLPVRASTLTGMVSSVLESLLSCLEARAKAASDHTQGALFLLNNALYIAKNMSDGKTSAVTELPEWKDGKMLDKYMMHFRDAVLAKIASSLEEPAASGGLLKQVNEHTEVKAKLKKFNSAFEELAIKQAGWNIPDEDRRKKTRGSVARRLREIYSAFLLPYREELCEFKTYRYSPDAIERVVLDYFFLSTPSRGIPISFG